MLKSPCLYALLAFASIAVWAQDTVATSAHFHQIPDRDGIYYVGPEVASPQLIRTVYVLYPTGVPVRNVQGMTVLAMVIGTNGVPANIQVLHSHGEAFDQAATLAVKQSVFQPGTLAGKPVPVWIDVRVVFRANHSPTTPEILIAERDLAPPSESQILDKHHQPLSYTAPFVIHSVDADFADPFTKHPYVQVAWVTVLVGVDGLPKEVRVRRGLGFGLDQKAEAAVWHYKFLPATRKGVPIEARGDIQVEFAKF